ncbi:MAG: hypothetical protein Q8R82_06670 [Hyphomonadaceae bacterium]|nr:hypothetical protein [Hyphomonadaceae bacterium]
MTRKRKFESWEFKVWQSGIEVASGDAPDEPTAKREAMHYAMMYAQDGPQVIVMVNPVGAKP